jgi:hypothetical protein
MEGFAKSKSIALMQAKVCNPSQFMLQEPQIPSLHDLILIEEIFTFLKPEKSHNYLLYIIKRLDTLGKFFLSQYSSSRILERLRNSKNY